MTMTVVRLGTGLFLIFPFLVLVSYFENWSIGDTSQFFAALEFSLIQASLSAVASLFFGFIGALGLNYWTSQYKLLRWACLLPNFVPPLFVVISVFEIVRPFPFGTAGIVLINTLINMGLCAVILQTLLQDKVGGWSELALVEGVSKWRFIFTTLRYLKSDLSYVAFFVFCICFSSLSIPLLAGRFNAASLELLIYEKIHLGENWDQVFGLSVLQSMIIFVLGASLNLVKTSRKGYARNLSLLQWRWGALPTTVAATLIVLELVTDAPMGWSQIRSVGWELFGIEKAIYHSALLALLTGIFTFILSGLICLSLPHERFEKFLSAYVAPSTTLTAFAFLILQWEGTLFTALALTCLLLPIVFRLNVSATFRGLVGQVAVARVMGASPWLIFTEITWPQVARSIGMAAGLVSFWAVGDFAVSGLLMTEQLPLAVQAKRLLESYRLEASTFFVLLILFVGSAFMFFFWSFGYVFSTRPLSRLRRF